MLLYDNFELVQKCCDSAFYLIAINGLRRILSPASKASREEANLFERKNPQTLIYRQSPVKLPDIKTLQ